MRHKTHHRKGIHSILSLILVITLLPALASAQDSGQDAGKQKPAAQTAPNQADNQTAQPASPVALAWADSYIRQIGSAGLLAGNREGIGWGSLYIPSASVYGIVDQFESTQTTPGATYNAAILQGTVVYDHRLGSSRLAVQYQPDMAISGGRVVGNFSNQNTSLDWLIYTRPRWNVKFTDGFRYSYTQQSFGMSYLDVNTASGGVNTNNFLDGPTRSLSNYATLSVAYALSRRASISIAPNFTYAEIGEGQNLDRASAYGGNVNWNYRLSERQTIGLQYSGELIHEAGLGVSATTPNVPTDTVFHTIAGTAGRQLSASMFVRGAAGVTTSSAAQNSRQWSFYGNLSLVKQLGRSSLGLNYTRADTIASGLIASEYADRVDLTLVNQLTTRLTWSPGVGYLRQVQSGGFSGWYATSNAQYLLAPRAGLFLTFDYFRKNQSSNTVNLFSGNRNLYSFGLRWQPGRVAH
ncbi:MAG TPA: hypothetical protein VJO16_11885 [Candidatus Acidoferrum sp.]|nr:hypothetical protein [Candidatus Acidoferrum sp.]